MTKCNMITTRMITAQVAGIPCLIDPTHVLVVPGSYSRDAASDHDYYGCTEVDFQVCDRRGRPAPWLERKLTPADRARLEQLILNQLEDD